MGIDPISVMICHGVMCVEILGIVRHPFGAISQTREATRLRSPRPCDKTKPDPRPEALGVQNTNDARDARTKATKQRRCVFFAPSRRNLFRRRVKESGSRGKRWEHGILSQC